MGYEKLEGSRTEIYQWRFDINVRSVRYRNIGRKEDEYYVYEVGPYFIFETT